jgi:hypothetical protein
VSDDGRPTVGNLPSRERELYVTRAELAELMSVSVATVDRLRSEALAWARARPPDQGRGG